MIDLEADPSLLGDRTPGDRAIRVAHVAAFAETSASGVDRTVVGLVTHLDGYGVVPEVWHLSPSHATVTSRRAQGITVVELPAYPRARSALSGLPEPTKAFVETRRHEIDLVHLHSVFTPDNVWVARAAMRPYVVTPNGGYSPEVMRGRNRVAKSIWMRTHERDYVRAASLVHAVSPRELTQLRASFGGVPLLFVSNAVDVPVASGEPADRMQGAQKRIVFLGRLAVDHKGLDLLLEGYARYLRARPAAETELILAGPDFRSGRAKLEALAKSLLPVGRVRFLGPVFGEEKDALLGSAHLFVHTSRWEGMPYAVLEALATGCPVLLTRATNLGEFVEEFRAGIVVEGTAEGIGKGLTEILEMPAGHYAAMCSGARTLAVERFTWPAVADQMSAAYRRVLA